MKIHDLELINNYNILLENKIILYGASEQGKLYKNVLKDFGIDIFGWCDSNSKKWETEFLGKKVFSPNELVDIEDENVIIIITSDWFKEILENLEANYNIKHKIYTTFGLQHCLNSNSENIKGKKELVEYFKAWRKVSENAAIYGQKPRTMQYIFNVCNKGSILVFQPGKVASMTICKSININENNKISASHRHGITLVKDEIKGYLNETRKNQKIKIISLCREPISRDISLFFDTLRKIHVLTDDISGKLEDYYFKFLIKNYCSNKIPECKASLGGEKRNLYGYFGWFDSELKEIFDIDILKYEFDKEKGYGIIKENNVELLLMKLEKLNSLEKVIGNFVELDNFKLVNDNESDKKMYIYAYNDFKKSLKLPKEYVDLYYTNNKYMDYFYSEEEKEKFYLKWKQNIIN